MELPEGVTYTEDDESIEVTVALADGVSRSDVRVVTTRSTLRVQQRVEGNSWRPVISGTLRHEVEQESCCWALEKRRAGSQAVVVQLEKVVPKRWDALLRADVAGSILEELGRDQVIVDAGADASESSVCGRCGALVKASRMEAHTTMWCEAIADGDDVTDAPKGAADEGTTKGPASHLYWARTPTNPSGAVPPQRLGLPEDGQVV